MSLQTRIFLFFAVSLFLSLILSVSVFLNLLGKENELFANPVVGEALDAAFSYYADGALGPEERLENVVSELEVISRESSRFSILRKDLFLKAGNALALFCVLQLLLLGLLSFFLSRAVARPWARIYSGLHELEAGRQDFRFAVGRSGDFSRLAGHLNRLLDTVRENERKLAEQSNLLGWKEAAAFLAHQFRNPLAAVALSGKNISLLAEENTPDRGLIGENVRILEDETRRLSLLMSRLRELTSFEKLEIALARLDDLFRKASERYAGGADIVFSGESAGPYPFDVQYMEQLFYNLANNSIEAAAGLGIRPVIYVAFSGDQGRESAVFRDSVTGLPETILEKLGQPRFTTRKTGTGLGLHIVRKIVALHGGTFRTELSGEGGLVFSMDFPRRIAYE